MTRWFLGVKVTDTQAGLKFLKKKVAQDVMPRVLVKQYAFDLEMLVVANQLGYNRVFEAPVELAFNNSVSGINPKTVRRMITDTLAIFYRARLLNYYRKQDDKRKKPHPPKVLRTSLRAGGQTRVKKKTILKRTSKK